MGINSGYTEYFLSWAVFLHIFRHQFIENSESPSGANVRDPEPEQDEAVTSRAPQLGTRGCPG